MKTKKEMMGLAGKYGSFLNLAVPPKNHDAHLEEYKSRRGAFWNYKKQ